MTVCDENMVVDSAATNDVFMLEILCLLAPTVCERKPFPRTFLRSQEAFPHPAGSVVSQITADIKP